MADAYEDILGSSRPIRRAPQAGSWFSFSFFSLVQVVLVLGLCYYLGSKAWKHLYQWRERSYKLATRRKYGIPDDDHRPFTVAYGAVKKARAGKAPDYGRKPTMIEPPASPAPGLRQRVPPAPAAHQASPFIPDIVPGGFTRPTPSPSFTTLDSNTASTSSYSNQSPHVTFADRNRSNVNGNHFAPSVPSTLNDYPQRVASGRKISILKPATKRPLDDYEDNEENIKKTRREDDLIDEDTAWDQTGARGSKRQLEYYGEEDDDEGQREKRARNAEEMDVDEEEAREGEDMLYDMDVSSPELSRGLKRHRADDEGSVVDDGEAGTTKTRRKRRNKRTSDVNAPRSRKRDRDLEDENMSDADDDDENTISRRSQPKRGKTSRRSGLGSSRESDAGSEIQGRTINDTWRSHGVNYKIGPNGQKLRQVYMRKPATKFVMPEDSMHPDRDANVQVFFEHWLTDEEYADAKSKGLLSWQETTTVSEPGTPAPEQSISVVTATPQRVQRDSLGKSMAWTGDTRMDDAVEPPSASSISALRPRISQEPFRPAISIASSVGLGNRSSRMSTFKSGTPDTTTPPSPGLLDSTNSMKRYQDTRTRWTKEEMERKAMDKMKEATQHLRKEEEKKLTASAVPAITLTKPEDNKFSGSSLFSLSSSKPDEKSKSATPTPAAGSGFSFGAPKESTPAATPAAAAPTTGNPLFAEPATPASDVAKPPSLFSAAPATAPKAVNQPSQLGLGKPSAPPSSSSGFSFGPTAGKPATSGPAPTTTPAATPSSPATKFPFGAPAAKAPEDKKAPSPAPASAGSFSFPPKQPSAPQLGSTSTPTSTSSLAAGNPFGGSGSAFGGGGGGSSAFGAPKAPAPATAAPTPSANPSGSIFGKTEGNTLFGGKPSAPVSGARAGATPSPNPAAAAPAAPKFSFGVTNGKPASPAPSNGSMPPPSAFGAAAPAPSNTSAPAPASKPLFSFGKPAVPAGTEAPKAIEAPKAAFGSTDAPKSAFGNTDASKSVTFGGGSAFGGNSSGNGFGGLSTNSTSEAPKAPVSAFGGGGSSSAFGAGTSAFGSTSSSAAPKSVFGGPSATASSSEAPKPASVFGSTPSFGAAPSTTTSAFGATGGTDASKTAPSAFGSTAPAANAFGSTAPASSTKSAFGASNTTSSFGGGAFGSSTTPSSSPFGNGGGASAFGGGAKATEAPKFSFGSMGAPAPAAADAPKGGEEASKPKFSFGSTPVTFNGGSAFGSK